MNFLPKDGDRMGQIEVTSLSMHQTILFLCLDRQIDKIVSIGYENYMCKFYGQDGYPNFAAILMQFFISEINEKSKGIILFISTSYNISYIIYTCILYNICKYS